MFIKGTMQRAIVVFVLFTGLATGGVIAAETHGVKINHWTTDQGVRVYHVEAPEIPMVEFELQFDAGAARDGDLGGLAMLTNGLIAEGAADLDASAIAARFESVGAIYGNSSQRDAASLSLRSLTDPPLLNQALETFVLVLGKPTFPQDSLERERSRMLVGLQSEQESLESLSEKAFYKALYNSHPYAAPERGTEATVKAIKREDVQRFFNDYYVASNAVLAIVGAVTEEEARSLAGKIGSALKKGQPAPALPPVASLEKPNTVRLNHPSQQAHILMGQPGVRRGDPDYFALYVGNHILGGSGLVSRLAEEIREKRGLSYSQYSYFAPMRLEGPYILGLQTKVEQAEQARQLLHDELKKFIAEGPTDAELQAAKQNITGGFPLRIAGNSKIVGYLGMIGFYKLPLDYLETFNANIEAVTKEQIKAAFAKRVNPEKLVTVVAGGEAAAPDAGG